MLIFILMLVSSLSAQDIDKRIFMPRSLALSGGMGARINLNESLYFNPASSAHARCFSLEGGFAWQHQSQIPSRIDNYYMNAIDTESDLFGGGVGYVKRTMGTMGREWELRGVMSKLITQRLGIGIEFSHLNYTYYGQNNTNSNANLGLIYLLTPKTIIGGTGYNLFGDKNDLNTRSVDLGIRHTLWDFFSCSLDFEYRFSKKVKVGGAVEMLYKNGFMVAVSLMRNQNIQTSYWGAGVGYIAPKISFLYGTMNSFSYPYSFMHSLSIRTFF